jgi:hypothetical protein
LKAGKNLCAEREISSPQQWTKQTQGEANRARTDNSAIAAESGLRIF